MRNKMHMKHVTTSQDRVKKIPVYIPELKLTVLVHPDSRIDEVRKKYIELKQFNRERLKVRQR